LLIGHCHKDNHHLGNVIMTVHDSFDCSDANRRAKQPSTIPRTLSGICSCKDTSNNHAHIEKKNRLKVIYFQSVKRSSR
jgi:hypothetical protein